MSYRLPKKTKYFFDIKRDTKLIDPKCLTKIKISNILLKIFIHCIKFGLLLYYSYFISI